MAQNEINIGVLATLIGPLTLMGEDAVHGVQLAISEFGGTVGNARLQMIVESTNAIPESASFAAETLVESHGVDFVVGPVSGNEGLVVRDYAKTRPDRVFLNGTSGSPNLTLRDPAQNFFNFSTTGVQWIAGLGSYAYQVLGYQRIVTLAQDYSYPHAQVGGFMIEYCRAGGKVIQKYWVPLGTTDFSAVISALPANTDAIFLGLAGADIANFLKQYGNAGGAVPLVAGTSAVDQTVLGRKDVVLENVLGIVSAGPTVDENPAPAWQTFVKAYRDRFSRGLRWPSLFAYSYYTNTKAALLALHAIDCDLSNDQIRFMEALRSLDFESPTGPVKLDHNRQAIANIFLKTVDRDADGALYTKLIKTIPGVNQTLGLPEDEYLSIGELNARNPTCA